MHPFFYYLLAIKFYTMATSISENQTSIPEAVKNEGELKDQPTSTSLTTDVTSAEKSNEPKASDESDNTESQEPTP
jgi:hypothetical protein